MGHGKQYTGRRFLSFKDATCTWYGFSTLLQGITCSWGGLKSLKIIKYGRNITNRPIRLLELSGCIKVIIFLYNIRMYNGANVINK